MNTADISTPAFIVDKGKVKANCQAMTIRANRLGVRLRPHMKTHKTLEVAQLQTEDNFGGITVSTLAEARFFGGMGYGDITYAVPISPLRLEEAAHIHKDIGRLNLILDHPSTFEALAEYAELHQMSWSVYLKVDSGYHRAGVDPQSAESFELARLLHEHPRIQFHGILTHAGHSYDCRNREEAAEVARQEAQSMAHFAQSLKESGIACPEVSIGSTPTCMNLTNAVGITEIRPGNYAFYDCFQAAIGSCLHENIAVHVLTTIIGHYPQHNQLIVDAGALALSKDPGATHVNPDAGFGQVEGYPHFKLVALSQEHGKIRSDIPIDFEALPIGSKLHILPNHSCLTAALYGRYHVMEGGERIGFWDPIRGW